MSPYDATQGGAAPRAIWKYALSEAAFLGAIPVRMPAGARILHVQSQRGTPCIWAEVDPTAPAEQRLFEVFGTGEDFEDADRRHLGTVLCADERLVWHIYERAPR